MNAHCEISLKEFVLEAMDQLPESFQTMNWKAYKKELEDSLASIKEEIEAEHII